MSQPPQDPIEFFQGMWAKAGVAFPAAVPGMDADAIDRKIAELKAVQGWLQTNLNMLQASIQMLEMQKAGAQALRQYGDGAKGGEGTEKK